MATAKEAGASTPQTSCSSCSLGPKQTSKYQLQCKKWAQSGWCQCTHPAPRPQDSVDDTYIRSINALSLHLKNRDPEQVKTICQRRHQLNNRPVPRVGSRGAGKGTRGPPRTQLYILSARWHSFHGSLLQYQRQLEGSLEIHTLSCELDAVTERIREKVSGQRANAA